MCKKAGMLLVLVMTLFMLTACDGSESMYKNAEVGSYILFGTYEQDGNVSNGKEDIEWLVLAKENNRLLVITRHILVDGKDYNEKNTSVTWETCTLRSWLNNDFLTSAFSSKEQAMIPTVTVSADPNPNYNTTPGVSTQDKVFLLSIVEATKYFKSDQDRLCTLTAYAKQESGLSYSDDFCCWWLRSPGGGQNRAIRVYPDGSIYERGGNVGNAPSGVRPALWINLEP